jgi:2-hydroxychromene-2-carboxylate isomerase
MSKSVDFYFDFSSPYGYLASTRVDDVAARIGAAVHWRPFLLGAVFKLTGAGPLVSIPLKGDYTRHDWARGARRRGVPFRLPAHFPFGAVSASRAYYHVRHQDPAAAVRLAKALFHAAFGEGRDISPLETVAAVAEAAGFDSEDILAGMQSAAVKESLKLEVETAIARGVFGSPFFIVGEEGFWGDDRLDDAAAWLVAGGW